MRISTGFGGILTVEAKYYYEYIKQFISRRSHNKPNDVHNTPEKSTGHTDGSAVLPTHARRRMQALRDGNLRPPLYYTQQEQTPCANGVWESPHTVASKLESKEEFPQG